MTEPARVFVSLFSCILGGTLLSLFALLGHRDMIHPLVLPAALMSGAVLGLLNSPIVIICLWRKGIPHLLLPIFLTSTMPTYLVAEVFDSVNLSVAAAELSLLVAVICCRAYVRDIQPPHCCQKCGYDLRESESRCPECNTPFDSKLVAAKGYENQNCGKEDTP